MHEMGCCDEEGEGRGMPEDAAWECCLRMLHANVFRQCLAACWIY